MKAFLSSFFLITFFASTAYANCQGCCSWHGGVCCINGITMCCDGTPLSSTCIAKGCDKCGIVSTTTTTTTSTTTTTTTTSTSTTSTSTTITTTTTSTTTTSTSSTTTTTLQPSILDTIKVASFNIQTLGPTKAGKPDLMQILAEIISNFDIVAIQEIRDASGTSIIELENLVDGLGINYSTITGPRLGRIISKEQYAFMYKSDIMTLKESYTYNDSEQDIFHREPFIAKFKILNEPFEFVLITIHTDPDTATQEIDALPIVINDAQNRFSSEQDFIILGDLNADCSYFDENDQTSPLRASKYRWLITNEMDTNVAESSCTYDRIIATNENNEDYTGYGGVFRFDQLFNLDSDETRSISDHFPIYSIFYVNKDTDFDRSDEVGNLIQILRICANIPSDTNNDIKDINADNKIGIEEAIYTMQILSGLKTE